MRDGDILALGDLRFRLSTRSNAPHDANNVLHFAENAPQKSE
jgi:hypothetical protein